MGILRSLAKKVVGAAKAVNEEASHPGRPPTFKASTNPFHEEPEERIAHEKAKAAAKAGAAANPPADPEASARTGQPWYLDNETDGWDETDPT